MKIRPHYFKNHGFTLVEILVVITVLGVVSTILTDVFIRNLRANNKAQIFSSLKNNGQEALEVMDKTIRNSDAVICPVITSGSSVTSSSVVVEKFVNGGYIYTTYKFIPETNPPNPVNGYITQDISATKPSDCSNVPGTQRLTDSNTKTGVSVKAAPAPFFKRDIQLGSSDVITIDFVLGPGTQYPVAATGPIDPTEFQTTISLR